MKNHRLPVSLRNFNKTLLACLALASFTLPACVTVNVNFPESAAQKATDDYVRDLYKARERGKQPTSESSPAPSATEKTSSSWEPILLSEAWAEDSLFKTQSPKTKEISARQAKRLDELDAYKRNGSLGESKDGKLVPREALEKQSKAKKARAEALMKDENADRDKLYAEVGKLNGVTGALTDVIRSFTHSFQAMSPSGSWVQNDSGEWTQKP